MFCLLCWLLCIDSSDSTCSTSQSLFMRCQASSINHVLVFKRQSFQINDACRHVFYTFCFGSHCFVRVHGLLGLFSSVQVSLCICLPPADVFTSAVIMEKDYDCYHGSEYMKKRIRMFVSYQYEVEFVYDAI